MPPFGGCGLSSNTSWLLRANSDVNNPYRCLREPLGVKGVRQSVVITNNPSTIDQNQQLLVRFPNLGAHDFIVPGTARLAFRISLDSEDANRTVVQNQNLRQRGDVYRRLTSSTVTVISGRRSRRGPATTIKASIRQTTATRR